MENKIQDGKSPELSTRETEEIKMKILPSKEAFISYFQFIKEYFIHEDNIHFIEKQKTVLIPYKSSVVNFNFPIESLFSVTSFNKQSVFFKDLNDELYLLDDFLVSNNYKFNLDEVAKSVQKMLVIEENLEKNHYIIPYKYIFYYQDNNQNHFCLMAPLESWINYDWKFQEGNEPCLNPYELYLYRNQIGKTIKHILASDIYNLKGDISSQILLPVAPAISLKAIYLNSLQEISLSLFFPYLSNPNENQLSDSDVYNKKLNTMDKFIKFDFNMRTTMKLCKEIRNIWKNQINSIIIRTLVDKSYLISPKINLLAEKGPMNLRDFYQLIDQYTSVNFKNDMTMLIEELQSDVEKLFEKVSEIENNIFSKYEALEKYLFLKVKESRDLKDRLKINISKQKSINDSSTDKLDHLKIIKEMVTEDDNSTISTSITRDTTNVNSNSSIQLKSYSSICYKVKSYSDGTSNSSGPFLILKLELGEDSVKKNENENILIEILPFWSKNFMDIKVSKSIPNSIEYRSDLFYLMDKVSMTFSTISFEIDTQKSNDTGLLIVLRCASLLDSFTNITDEIIYSIDSMVIIMLILNKVMKYITQDVITDKESDQTKAFDRERVKFLSTKSDEIIQEMETHIKQYRKLWQSQKIFEKILE